MTKAVGCDVAGCHEWAVDCLDRRLCMAHGTAANVALAAQGLDVAPWVERVAAVSQWLSRLNGRAQAGVPLGLGAARQAGGGT